jgi:flavin reductase (DIM6/NTAB) family NADH-FMN oxidoreductase RutF
MSEPAPPIVEAPHPESTGAFRAMMSGFPTGVAVVTATDSAGRGG